MDQEGPAPSTSTPIDSGRDEEADIPSNAPTTRRAEPATAPTNTNLHQRKNTQPADPGSDTDTSSDSVSDFIPHTPFPIIHASETSYETSLAERNAALALQKANRANALAGQQHLLITLREQQEECEDQIQKLMREMTRVRTREERVHVERRIEGVRGTLGRVEERIRVAEEAIRGFGGRIRGG